MTSGRPEPATYRSRSSAFDPAILWRLTDDALVREVVGTPPSKRLRMAVAVLLRMVLPWMRSPLFDRWPDKVPYRDIESIRLTFDPTRFDRNRYRCELRGSAGARASIFSTSYVSLANFADQPEPYRVFMNSLIERVQRARPEIPILGGLSWLQFIGQFAFLFATLMLVVVVVFLAGLPGLVAISAKLAVLAGSLGLLWRYAYRNWPRTVTPLQERAATSQRAPGDHSPP
jgi:hypothetical protein